MEYRYTLYKGAMFIQGTKSVPKKKQLRDSKSVMDCVTREFLVLLSHTYTAG